MAGPLLIKRATNEDLIEVDSRPRILALLERYLPGHKSGGPIQAIANMVSPMSADYRFFILTSDRDVGDAHHFRGVEPNCWHHVGDALVMYSDQITLRRMYRALQTVRPDILYLNSYFSFLTRKALLLRRLGLLCDAATILAPRGEFSPGALHIKHRRKGLYMWMARQLGLYDGILWHASAEPEKTEILGRKDRISRVFHPIVVANEFATPVVYPGKRINKVPGHLDLAYISRISEKKNLHFLLRVLAKVRGEVRLNIYGPIAPKDEAYWALCQRAANELPPNVIVRYGSSVEHDQVPQLLAQHHVFVLPTLGENYCHAAVESLMSGTPVLISDLTPWRELHLAGAGFDLPLSDPEAWTTALQYFIDVNQSDYQEHVRGAIEYSRRCSSADTVQQNGRLFRFALNLHSGTSATDSSA
jgi:glycosyltransferase involved in cell wall biosynthesis